MSAFAGSFFVFLVLFLTGVSSFLVSSKTFECDKIIFLPSLEKSITLNSSFSSTVAIEPSALTKFFGVTKPSIP